MSAGFPAPPRSRRVAPRPRAVAGLLAGLAIALAGCGKDEPPLQSAQALRSCLERAGIDATLDEAEPGAARELRAALSGTVVSLRVYAEEREAEEREQERLFYAEDEDERLFARRRNVYVEWDDPPTDAEATAVYACLPK